MEEKEDSLPCPLFFRIHCPHIKRGCKFHHNTQMCSQGGACGTKTCALRHPPNCQLFLQGWCGFITEQGVPKRYKHCSYFHPPNVKQIPPSPIQKQQTYIRLQFDSNDNRICKLWESLGREEHSSASQFQDKTDKKLMELENKLTTAAARQRDGAPSNLKSKFFRPK